MQRNMSGSLSGAIDEMLSGSVAGNVRFETPQGSSNYNDLTNKPSINDVELSGNKTTSDLGLFSGNYDDLANKPTIPDAPTVMIGASSQNDGSSGYVPQPQAGDEDKILNGAGQWVSAPTGQINYSTDEQIIGKWIDGTNLYRKVYTGLDFTPIYNTWSNIITNLPQNFKNLIKVDLIINTGSNGYNDLSASGLEITHSISENAIRIESNQSANIRPINIFAIIYTKTTD